MAGSAISTPTAQLVNANVQNDGSADSPRGWAVADNADYTFTASGASRARVTATSTNRSVNLPSTGVQAGKEYEVVTSCSGGFTIAIKSSDGDTIDTLKGSKGRIRLVAVTSPFTDGTHWEVVEVYDEGDWTPVIADAASGGNTGTGTFNGYYTRNGSSVSLFYRLSSISTAGMTAGNAIHIRGLPFSSANLTNLRGGGAVHTNNITFGDSIAAWMAVNVQYFNFYKTSAGVEALLIVSNLSANAALTGVLTYRI